MDESLSEGIMCPKQNSGDGAKVGEKANEEVQEIRTVGGAKSAFTSLKLFIGKRFKEVGEEGGSREGFNVGTTLS